MVGRNGKVHVMIYISVKIKSTVINERQFNFHSSYLIVLNSVTLGSYISSYNPALIIRLHSYYVMNGGQVFHMHHILALKFACLPVYFNMFQQELSQNSYWADIFAW